MNYRIAIKGSIKDCCYSSISRLATWSDFSDNQNIQVLAARYGSYVCCYRSILEIVSHNHEYLPPSQGPGTSINLATIADKIDRHRAYFSYKNNQLEMGLKILVYSFIFAVLLIVIISIINIIYLNACLKKY